MKKKLMVLATALVLMFLLVGCTIPEGTQTNNSGTTPKFIIVTFMNLLIQIQVFIIGFIHMQQDMQVWVV